LAFARLAESLRGAVSIPLKPWFAGLISSGRAAQKPFGNPGIKIELSGHTLLEG
jgi:hypothetical protein